MHGTYMYGMYAIITQPSIYLFHLFIPFSPPLQVLLGYNSWEVGVGELQLSPTSLWRSEFEDWWATPIFEVPQQVSKLEHCGTAWSQAGR